MKSKQSTWRRLILAVVLAGFALVLLVIGARTPSVATSQQGRQIECNIPKKVPIKLKLKAEKEAKFKTSVIRNGCETLRSKLPTSRTSLSIF